MHLLLLPSAQIRNGLENAVQHPPGYGDISRSSRSYAKDYGVVLLAQILVENTSIENIFKLSS
jgi:hypothetical protein